ncbi:hypothetical protein RI844_19020 [Thalassotalea fonticola]|uniref:DUF2846 domain-containing protein n=1 Tax=Thalassotalea fonticola TaxID=3065649 RepID=A0ABZ0GNX7_9GAMM|nr:hypothetical protein RI844_19020 [Colwelliaceae bacterium S1-1]
MTQFKLLLLACLAIILTACATKVSSIKKEQSVTLNQQKKEGFFLLAVDTNRQLQEIVISGPKSIALGKEDLKKGNNYILLNLPEGEYTLSKIKFNKYARLKSFDDELWSFRVEKNAVSYVGHLSMKVYTYWWYTSYSQLELLNNSSIALEYMENNFPTILAGKKMQYAGPGKDNFFNVVRPQYNTTTGE